jgi:hypothetical protein
MYGMFELSGYWWEHILMEIKLAHNTLGVIWLNHPNKGKVAASHPVRMVSDTINCWLLITSDGLKFFMRP